MSPNSGTSNLEVVQFVGFIGLTCMIILLAGKSFRLPQRTPLKKALHSIVPPSLKMPTGLNYNCDDTIFDMPMSGFVSIISL